MRSSIMFSSFNVFFIVLQPFSQIQNNDISSLIRKRASLKVSTVVKFEGLSSDALIIRRLFISKSNAINLKINLLKTTMITITMLTSKIITMTNLKIKITTIRVLKSVIVIIIMMLIIKYILFILLRLIS